MQNGRSISSLARFFYLNIVNSQISLNQRKREKESADFTGTIHQCENENVRML